MPRLNDDVMDTAVIQGTGFQYSATRIEHLGATEYTLVTIVQDVSGSVDSYRNDMEKCLQTIIEACKKSPRMDNLMIRLLTFNTQGNEQHGYKLLMNCNVADYKGILRCGGGTALFDATYNAIQATADYAKILSANDFDVNSVVFVITDGDDNSSGFSASKVAEVIANAKKNESIESIVTVLVGVGMDGNPTVDKYLSDFQTQAKMDAYVKITDATPGKLAKLAEFVSKSISSQSSSLGTGSAAQIQSLTI